MALLIAAVAGAAPAWAQACPDDDLDGYADCTVPGCDSSGLLCGDCDDGDPDANPGEPESCNQQDDDCDGLVDEGSTKPASSEALYDPDPDSGDELGESVAGPGDLTGDGTPDVVAGAYLDDDQASAAGSVHLFSGADCSWVRRMTDVEGGGSDYLGFSGADGARIGKWSNPAGQSNDRLGFSVAGVGDLDGDGVPDVAAGADQFRRDHQQCRQRGRVLRGGRQRDPRADGRPAAGRT